MADQKLSALSAIPTSDINNSTLLYVVDTVGTDTSYQVTRSALYLAVANIWTAQQTLTVSALTPLIINIATAPVGSSSEFIGALKVSPQTMAFVTTPQTGDYSTNKIDQATLTNPSSGIITNASTLKIVGSPIPSTNVTITNNYSLWVASGTSLLQATTLQGNLSMGANAILFGGSYKIVNSNLVGIDGTITTITNQSNNSLVQILFLPTGTAKNSGILINRVSDLTNWELLQIQSDAVATGEMAIRTTAGGSGTIRPLNLYVGSTKVISYDVANTISLYVPIIIYNGIATAGIGVPAIYGSTLQKSETGADTNVLTYTPPAKAGKYRITFSAQVSAANTATFGWTATWKDSNGTSQAPTNMQFLKAGGGAGNVTLSATAGDNYYGIAIIDIDNSGTNIVIKTTFSGTSIAYKASASIEQLS